MPSERDITRQWLANLDPDDLQQLLDLAPNDPMPRALADDLAAVGVRLLPL